MSLKIAAYKNDYKINKLPIFFQPWWLDIACQLGKWDICLVNRKDGQILGVLPYYITSTLGIKIIRTPPFTPYLGVWIEYSQNFDRNVNKYSFENEVLGRLVEQLPIVAWYHQCHPEQLENWLPFFWKGYRQTTRYTYVLEDLNTERVFAGMKSEVRTRLRKAEGLYTVVEDNSFNNFYEFYERTMKRQGISLKKNKKILKELHANIQSHGLGAIYYAITKSREPAAALYMIWDKTTAYYWLPCMDKEAGAQGAAQLLIWHSIQVASKIVKRYNFEGSMLPHIEPVFRAFGAERKPVFQIRKFGNRFLEAAWVLLKG